MHYLFKCCSRKSKTKDESPKPKREPYFDYLNCQTGLPEVDKLIQQRQQVRRIQESVIRDSRNFIIDGASEDRISGLPDDVLQFVISLLPMREGAATSILSTRWRHLWSASVFRLSFDDLNLLGYRYQPHFICGCGNMKTNKETTKFMNRADHICQFRRRDLRMDTLQVSFILYQDFAARIDEWMDLAAYQGVNKLALNLFPTLGDGYMLYCLNHMRYIFPVEKFESSLNYLELQFCSFQFAPDFHGLDSLVFLSLSYCVLTQSDLQNIVSNCPLQCLILSSCDFLDPAFLEFDGPSIQLKHLHISGYWNYSIMKIELRDINLSSFELEGFGIELSIKNVPCLKRLVLHADGPVEISDNLSGLETLFLKHGKSELQLSAYNNLKRLVFSVSYRKENLFEVVCFLEAFPLLQQLELDNPIPVGDGLEGLVEALEELNSKISSRLGCSHHNLKEVYIYGFDCHFVTIELAKYLLENATVLEKMIFCRKSKWYKGNGICFLSRKSAKPVGMSLENVYNVLREKAPPTTEILIM